VAQEVIERSCHLGEECSHSSPATIDWFGGDRLTFQLGSLLLERPLRVARFFPIDNPKVSSRSRGPSKTACSELKPACQLLAGSCRDSGSSSEPALLCRRTRAKATCGQRGGQGSSQAVVFHWSRGHASITGVLATDASDRSTQLGRLPRGGRVGSVLHAAFVARIR
jgi:hypothetical protein